MFKMLGFLFLGGSMASAGVFSEGVRFFDEDVTKVPVQKTPPSQKTKPFSWNDQLDVEKDQFFKEGDYMPPAPLIEALRRPTKENILNFEKWQQMRNVLLARYESARLQYTSKTGVNIPRAVGPSTNLDEKDLEKYHYVFYFDSTCSACHGMFQTINQMVQRGVYVEAVRMDNKDGEVKGLDIPWRIAEPDELKNFISKPVPILVAIDEKTKRAYQMTGRKTIREILQVIQQGSKTAG